MSQPAPEQRITVRKNLDFGLDSDDIPRYWLAGDAYKTRLIDAVQATFPDGERYFISCVRAFRDQVTDPTLRAEVKDFMMQEGQHGMVHSRYNERLNRQGMNMRAFELHTKKICDRRQKVFSAEYNLALTAALEHFTAMMADLFFAEKSVLEGSDERVRAMLAWHAVEEMEHKSVAFDVLQQVAKVGYLRRVLAMTQITFSFGLFCFLAPWFMLRTDGYSRWQRVKMYVKGSPWMFGPRRGILVRLLPMIARYYKPGFHPQDIKNVHNYGDWVQRFDETGDPVQAGRAMYSAAA